MKVFSVSMVFQDPKQTGLSVRIIKATSEEEAFGIAYKQVSTNGQYKNWVLLSHIEIEVSLDMFQQQATGN